MSVWQKSKRLVGQALCRTGYKLQGNKRYDLRNAQTLVTLYDIAASIDSTLSESDLAHEFLQAIVSKLQLQAGAIRLLQDGDLRLVAFEGVEHDPEAIERHIPATASVCGEALRLRSVQWASSLSHLTGAARYLHETGSKLSMVSVPIQYRDRCLGVFNLFTDNRQAFKGRMFDDFLLSIGKHLGMAIEKQQQDAESNRLAIMEERNRISNELHDSLAQTIASMRFYTSLMIEQCETLCETPVVCEQAHRLDRIIEEANTEIRELIAHCRAPMDRRGLLPAVESAVEAFRENTGISAFLQIDWEALELPPAHALEIFRIVQESLANIRKHAQASHVRVLLRAQANGQLTVMVEDDGCGFEEQQKSTSNLSEHIGLGIMHTRAARIGASLDIDSDLGEGTRITLNFHYTPPNTPGLRPKDHELARTAD